MSLDKREECPLLSDTNITLYNQLADVSLQIEKSVASGDYSDFGEFTAIHNKVITQIKKIGQIEDKKMIAVIQKAEKSVKRTMTVIKEKQVKIIQQLNAEKNKKLLSNSYNM